MEWVLWICIVGANGCARETVSLTAGEAACIKQLATVKIGPMAEVNVAQATSVEVKLPGSVVASCVQRVKKG